MASMAISKHLRFMAHYAFRRSAVIIIMADLGRFVEVNASTGFIVQGPKTHQGRHPGCDMQLHANFTWAIKRLCMAARDGT